MEQIVVWNNVFFLLLLLLLSRGRRHNLKITKGSLCQGTTWELKTEIFCFVIYYSSNLFQGCHEECQKSANHNTLFETLNGYEGQTPYILRR